MQENSEKYPEGQFVGMWMGIGLAIFTGVGLPLSIALKIPGLMGIGPALGIAFGLSVGQSIESKYKREGKIRPLTEDEKKKRKRLVIAGICVLLLGLLVFLLRLFP
jgi:cadmium resistance protein CadD (predicted permease)